MNFKEESDDLEAVLDSLLLFISDVRKSVRQGESFDVVAKRGESLIERKGTSRQVSKERPETQVNVVNSFCFCSVILKS